VGRETGVQAKESKVLCTNNLRREMGLFSAPMEAWKEYQAGPAGYL
jgi:hypothetical protein